MLSSNTSAVSGDTTYIEDVFSTYIYAGDGTAPRNIVNGIDLAGKGGLVWIKNRGGAESHALFDTARGRAYSLSADLTTAQTGPSGSSADLVSFNADGFTTGTTSNWALNFSGRTYTARAFREQPKFFDVVTWTGDGVAGRAISHNLGSTPGFITIKRTSAVSDWPVWHRSSNGGTGNAYAFLNSTSAFTADNGGIWGDGSNYIAPTSTTFTVNSNYNGSGSTYVAYLFAHDAGGFGLTGTDNVISCGSFTADGSGNATVDLGYEPQWLLFKRSNGVDNWREFDTMRGWSMTQDNFLFPNTSGAETASSGWGNPTATGFTIGSATASATYIYIAIRRGPMKVPTDATKVFSPIASTSTTGTNQTTGFRVDAQLASAARTGADNKNFTMNDRLRGVSSTATVKQAALVTSAVSTEAITGTLQSLSWDNTSFQTPSYLASISSVYLNFQRAPSFFDEVCYTGDNGLYTAVPHNLKVVPEFVITKCRNASFGWQAWHSKGNVAASATGFGWNSVAAAAYPTNDFTPYMLATTFTPGLVYDETGSAANIASNNYVAWLFATCPGVSKVGSYTGTGATLQINCGFAAGARMVLIKRIDSTGAWYLWDTARGIVSGNDPYLLLNTTAAEVTTTDYIDPYSAGFEISSTANASINASGGTFIYLAIA